MQYTSLHNHHPLTLSLFFLAAAITSQADVINFTTAEGYVDGNLKDQPSGGGATWTYTNASAAYVVDVDNGGSVISDPSQGYAPAARFTDPIPLVAGQTIKISMDFQFIGMDVTSKIERGALYLSLADASSSRQIFGSLGHPSWGTNDFYQMQWYMGAGTPSSNVAPASLGLDNDGGELSDHLRMTISVNVASSGNSAYSISLHNLDTDTNVADIDTGYRDLTGIPNLYASFIDSTSPLTISQISYSTVPEPSSFALLMGGLVGMAAFARRARKA